MNYQISDTTIEQLGSQRRSSVSCKVKGYWSSDSITLYVNRSYSSADWEISVSHSSGGRDKKEVASDVEASRYFAEAMVAMCDVADHILSQKDRLEAAYQAQLAEYRAEIEKERAEREAMIAADEELGETRAKEIVDQMVTNGNCVVEVFKRGEARAIRYEVKTYNNTMFYNNYDRRVSKAEVIAVLSSASVRSKIV